MESWHLQNKSILTLPFQIRLLRIASISFGIGLCLFALYRFKSGDFGVSLMQVCFALFLFVSFFLLERSDKYYRRFAMVIFVAMFGYMIFSFFHVEDNRLNILWIVISPLFVYFFLDRKGGAVIYGVLVMFVVYLYLIDYGYNVVEYITLLAVISTVSFLLYGYETYKSAYIKHLERYNRELKEQIACHTQALKEMNVALQEKIEYETQKRLDQEKMLLRQNRLAHVGQMVDAIAHQWRQPLAVINALLLHLRKEVQNGADKSQKLCRIQELFEQTRYMSQTINDFRAMMSTSGKQIANIGDVIAEVLTLLGGGLKGIKCDIKTSDSDVKVLRSEFAQVLIIILSNAIDAFKQRGVLESRLRIGLRQKFHFAIVEIEDNAGGIESKILQRVFEPYVTSKKKYGGSGLGLYIAKIIVEEYLRGKIEAKNTAKGAMFRIIVSHARQCDDRNT